MRSKAKVKCPHCDQEQSVEVGTFSIQNDTFRNQIKNCNMCCEPFVVGVRASFEWRIGLIEWSEEADNEAR